MMAIEKVEIISPPAYLEQSGGASTGQKSRYVKYYAIGAVAATVVIALVIGGVLGGVYLQNKSTKELIKEFTLSGKDKSGNAVQEKVKVDAKRNEEEISVNNGKLRILEDYNKGLVVMRTTFNKLACYLKPLNKTGVTEPKALKNYLASVKISDENKERYDESVAYTPAREPVGDRSFLSARAQDMCKGLDVYWMFPVQQKGRVKRGWCRRVSCYFRLYCVWGRGCYRRYSCGVTLYYC